MGEPTIYKPSIYKGNGIYKNGASGVEPGDRPEIPAGFEMLGAIYWNNNYNSFTSSGLTILSTSNKWKIYQKIYKPNTGTQNAWVYLFKLGDWNSDFSNIQINTYTKNISVKNNSSVTTITKELGQGIHEFIIQQNKFSIDGIENNIAYSEKTGIIACFPFPLSSDRYKPDPIFAMYEFKVVDDMDKVIVDFVPVKRKADNAIGVFDVARGYFYNNSYFAYYNI